MSITTTHVIVTAAVAAIAVWCFNRLNPFGTFIIMSLVCWAIIIGVLLRWWG